jgi:Peptidase A4 family
MSDLSVETVPTEIEEIEAFRPLPDNFDIATAAPQELRRYGFPARPDAEKFPQQYALWKRVVNCKQIQPKLVRTNVLHGPAKKISKTGVSAGGSVSTESDNWSGIVILDAKNPFVAETVVQATWTVPKPNAGAWPPGGVHTCSQWVGIDGFDSNDVLQAGTSTNYNNGAYPPYAWIEWFPNHEIQISNLPILWGDEITTSVAWVPSQSRGVIHVSNLSQNVASAPLYLTPPNGVKLVGNSVEWIVERPVQDGVQLNLANYFACFMSLCTAGIPTGSGLSLYLPGSAPTGTIYNVHMSQPPNGTVSSATVISTPYEANSGIIFQSQNM